MTYATAFPDYPAHAIPVLPDGWRDNSWRNDACPCFHHDESGVVLWCDYPAQEDREHGKFSRHYEFVQLAERAPDGAWQYGEGDRAVLRCDNLGEVVDLLDSIAAGLSMGDALRFARMRLNQLTPDDARAFMAENDAAAKPCPDLHAHCLEIIAAAEAAPPVSGSVLDEWARVIPGTIPADDAALFASMPADSTCGADCVKAIRAAADLLDALANAGPARGAFFVQRCQTGITDAARYACSVYIAG